MKKFIALCVIVYAGFLGNSALNAHEIGWTPCDKTYVSLDKLFICHEGIFVHLEEKWFQVPMINHDTSGVFINSLFPVNNWTCDLCYTWNGPWRTWCSNPNCDNYGPY